jgi:hypothetical protein
MQQRIAGPMRADDARIMRDEDLAAPHVLAMLARTRDDRCSLTIVSIFTLSVAQDPTLLTVSPCAA